MKDTNRAISSFQTAVQNDPKYVDAYMQLGLVYQSKKDRLALKYFENAFQADTTNIEPVYAQAMFWQNQNEMEEAKKIYRRMVNIDRSYPKSYYNMGWVLMQQDSVENAIRQFTIAIENKPDYADAYYNRGICNETLNKLSEALEDYNQALSFDKDNANYNQAQKRVSLKIK
ncbi:MAG TPA: tetratricopeptide repeat protein [Chitinophagaceae bacterium]|nr:tetratricopeptide repeat protein [Chitinophagaceae bacterium]